MIKIMHTGDIHLDSPFSSLTSRQAEVRRNELRAAFTSMMTYAKMNNTDLLLIAGDVFDAEYVTRETVSLLFWLGIKTDRSGRIFAWIFCIYGRKRIWKRIWRKSI